MNISIIQSRINKIQKYLSEFPYIHQKFRIGAMILNKRGRVKSLASNSYTKTHPIMTSGLYNIHKLYLHAEMSAIISCQSNIEDSDIMIVVRIDSNNNLKCSRPCEGCMNYIVTKTCIKYVYYINNKGDLSIWSREGEK